MMYAELIGNYKKQRIKSLYDNRIVHVEYGHRTRQGTGHNNPGKKYKYKPKPNGIAYIEGVYMLKTSFEKTEKNLEEDLDKLLKKYGFK